MPNKTNFFTVQFSDGLQLHFHLRWGVQYFICDLYGDHISQRAGLPGSTPTPLIIELRIAEGDRPFFPEPFLILIYPQYTPLAEGGLGHLAHKLEGGLKCLWPQRFIFNGDLQGFHEYRLYLRDAMQKVLELILNSSNATDEDPWQKKFERAARNDWKVEFLLPARDGKPKSFW